ncbi:MAG: transporter substrate-binding domain-containing protein [Syntrophomonadaceae bacterium]|nr:transporter substrate-binding domain-containing protein [Syntrophomonadaceae bacterium]
MVGKRYAIGPIITTVAAVLAIFIFACVPTANAQPEAGLKIAGKAIETDPAPFIDNNRVMVPVRDIADALGADVSWDGEKQAVTIVKGNNEIAMVIGNSQVMINGEQVTMKVLPVIVDDRTMAPVRILADGLQVPISWDNAAKIVNLEFSALIAGSSVDFPPFEFKDGNEYVGFEMDLLDALEKELGVEITVKDISFDQLIPSLRSGQVDLIISGLTIHEPRKEIIDFTRPYFDYGDIILTVKGSNQEMILDDLAGNKIACQLGTQSQEAIDELVKRYPKTQRLVFDTLEEIWSAMEEGQADAAIVPYAPTAYYLTEHSESNLQMVGKVFASQSVGIAVQKGDQQLLDKLNQGLETLYKNGTYDRIYEKWFGPKIEVIGVA